MIDGAKLLKRLEQLRARRSVVEEEWRQCFNYTYPLRGAAFESLGSPSPDPTQQHVSSGTTKQDELLDSTGTDSVRILASALMSGLTPANSRWFGLDAGNETDEEKRWLDESAQMLWENIHASNYDAVGFECMLDMAAAGMFPMFVEEAEGGGFRFESWSLANTYFAASMPGGPVDTVFNEFPLSAEQAVHDYGEEMLSEQVRKQASEKPDEVVQFVRCVYPRSGTPGRFSKNLPFASTHIECQTKKVVRESGYHELPVGVPRWSPVPGSVYAFGPVKEALPDLKTLNEVVKYDLANMDLAVAGMWGAVDDGVLNARSIKIGPRKVIVMAEKENFWPLTPGGDFKAALLEIDRLQRSIRKVLMADQLEPQKKAGEPPTATEIVVRVEMIRQLLGPVYGRMQSEFLQWLVTRCFGIAYRAGVFSPPPRSLMTRVLSVRYVSPIARAQKAVDVAAMDRFEASLAQEAAILGESVLDNYDWDEAARMRAELLGVPAKLIPDKDDIETLREKRGQQAQAMQIASMAAQAAGAPAGVAAALPA